MPLDLFDLILLDVDDARQGRFYSLPGYQGAGGLPDPALLEDRGVRSDAGTETAATIISKPFGIGELRARVAAICGERRGRKSTGMSVRAFQFELKAKKCFAGKKYR